MGDYSADETLVEYAVQEMFKKKPLKSVAKAVAKKFTGSTNLFIGSGDVISVNATALEEALWQRLVTNVVASIPRLREDKKHYAIDGVLQQFYQKPTMRPELKKRTIAALGSNPFTHDDQP